MVEPDTLDAPPDETHEPVIRAKWSAPTRAQILAGYEANYQAQLKVWKAAKKALDEWNKPEVREAHLTNWWAKIDKSCHVEIAKDRAKLRRKQALARIQTNLARIELGVLKKQLEQAREDVFFGDCEESHVSRLEERINNRCCDLAQREEEEARHAIPAVSIYDVGKKKVCKAVDPDYEKRELSIARAEHFAGLREESIQELKKEIAKYELKGNAAKVRTLTEKLKGAIGPDPIAVAKKAAMTEARRQGNWSEGEVYIPALVKSPARIALEAYLNEVVRRAREEIRRGIN